MWCVQGGQQHQATQGSVGRGESFDSVPGAVEACYSVLRPSRSGETHVHLRHCLASRCCCVEISQSPCRHTLFSLSFLCCGHLKSSCRFRRAAPPWLFCLCSGTYTLSPVPPPLCPPPTSGFMPGPALVWPLILNKQGIEGDAVI